MRATRDAKYSVFVQDTATLRAARVSVTDQLTMEDFTELSTRALGMPKGSCVNFLHCGSPLRLELNN